MTHQRAKATAAISPKNPQILNLSDIYHHVFAGERAELWQRLSVIPAGTAPAEDQTGIDLLALHAPACLGAIVEDYCEKTYPEDDRRAAISMWTQWYFGLVLPCLILPVQEGGCHLPYEKHELGLSLICTETSRPARFILADRPAQMLDHSSSNTDCWSRLGPLIDGHLTPLIEALAGISKLSPRVFWMNASVMIAYIANTARARQSGTSTTSPSPAKPSAADIYPVYTDKLRPDGTRNPLFGPHSDRKNQEGNCLRRVCCLRYQLSEVAMCPNCPLDPAKVQAAKQQK